MLTDLGSTPERPDFFGDPVDLLPSGFIDPTGQTLPAPSNSELQTFTTPSTPSNRSALGHPPTGTQLPTPLLTPSSGAADPSDASSLSHRKSGRTTKQPVLYGNPVSTVSVIEQDLPAPVGVEPRDDAARATPSRKKTSESRTGRVPKRTGRPSSLSGKKLAGISGTQDGPDASVQEPSVANDTPIPQVTRAASPKVQASNTSRRASQTPRPTTAQKTAKTVTLPPRAETPSDLATQVLPDTSTTIRSQSEPLADPDLLRLSRALTFREPLDSKPAPQGQPEVWAPDRQELCETLPYFKSPKSGCYANGGTIYAFLFDRGSTQREYMDQDVIIARVGGSMGEDKKTGMMFQKEDHKLSGAQPQAFVNNMAQRNPIVVICGNQNACSPSKMPHGYCVLGFFKPTHIWTEKTKGSGTKVVKTSRYRLERLNRSQPAWYTPSAVSTLDRSELPLPSRACAACHKVSPQVYLVSWLCLNTECERLWKMPNGIDAPYVELDYHPAFLLARTPWEREQAPFSLNPGIPDLGRTFGDALSYINTRGIVCPKCGRCNYRYLWRGWQCDAPGCDWRLDAPRQVVQSRNLGFTAWDMPNSGYGLTKVTCKPVASLQHAYHNGHKVLRITIQGLEGCVLLLKASQRTNAEPGGPDDMFRELQIGDIGLERRMLRGSHKEGHSSDHTTSGSQASAGAEQEQDKGDGDDEDEIKGEAGIRMTAFGMNYGMPYKFIANGDSKSFDAAPEPIRAARSRLDYMQRIFLNEPECYQQFNELLAFGYMEGGKIKYHDDGEAGLGPTIGTLSLGASATMTLRVKSKYYSQTSGLGIFTDEKPLPLPLLESSGYSSGYQRKVKDASKQANAKASKDTYEGRVAAWQELQVLKATDRAAYLQRAKAVAKELELKRKQAEDLVTLHLGHGDVMFMHGEDIQKYLEHQVIPHGSLRFALTCRNVLPGHLKPDQLPTYEVKPDDYGYDGSAIREGGDGETVVWRTS